MSGKPHIPVVRMQDFNYNLPDERIAIYPAAPRGSSRLLVVKLGQQQQQEQQQQHELEHSSFPQLAQSLPRDAHLVFNESLVFSARVFACVAGTGAPPPVAGDAPPHQQFEVLFLNPEAPFKDPAEALTAAYPGQVWRCMVRKHFDAPGARLALLDPSGSTSTLLEVVTIHLAWHEHGEEPGIEADIRLVHTPSCDATTAAAAPQPIVSLSALLSRCGETPLPPYLHRSAEPADREAYQNVYASPKAQGSVAAPTAGLHFTQPLLDQLAAAGTTSSSLALHVSAATFKPVTAELITDHEMHKESFEVHVGQLQDILRAMQSGRPIVSVGTTSTRLLESLYWLGVKERLHAASAPSSSPHSQDLDLEQWEAFELGAAGPELPCTAADAYHALIQRAHGLGISRMFGFTSLCIVPGYKYAVTSALITNFHQPDSTLLLLVAAFIGDTTGRTLVQIYDQAVQAGYRFLSYGDACLFVQAGM